MKICLICLYVLLLSIFIFLLAGILYCLFNLTEVKEWGLFWVFVIMLVIFGYILFRLPTKINLEVLKENKIKNMEQEKQPIKKNKLAIVGFILGIASIPFSFIGIIPILALIFSGIGLYQAKERKEGGAVLAIIGLILGAIYTLVYMRTYGHI